MGTTVPQTKVSTADAVYLVDQAGVPCAVADNAANPGGPVMIGGSMSTVNGGPAAGTTGAAGRAQFDASRRQIIQPLGNPPSHKGGYIAALATTTETTLLALTASLRILLQTLTIANHDTVACIVDLRDATAGVVRETFRVAPGTTQQFFWPAGRPATAVAQNWTVQLRAAITTTGVDISASAFNTFA